MKATSSIQINVPIEKVFRFASNPANFPSYISCINDVRKIKPNEPSLGQTFQWVLNLAGITLEGKGEVTKFEPNNLLELKTSGGVNSAWINTFEETPMGTKFTIDVSYDIDSQAVDKIGSKLLVEKLCELIANQITQNLKVINETREK